jgi:hypothetical protein
VEEERYQGARNLPEHKLQREPVVDLTNQLEDSEEAELDNQLSSDSDNFSNILGFHDVQYFEKVEEIYNNSDDSSDVVTNTGVEDTEEPVGGILLGEDNAVTLSELLACLQ